MFERFTPSARGVVERAREESGRLHDHRIGTEHLLLGILGERDEVTARVFARLDLTLDELRADVKRATRARGSRAFADEDADALRLIGIDLDEVRRRAEETFGPRALERSPSPCHRRGRRAPSFLERRVPLTPDAKKALELALRHAIHRGDRFIGSEHLLLALVHDDRFVAARLLRAHGITPAQIRAGLADVADGAA
jgi:ATP-dependent Clp protease ATP-binding subunit ClpA